VYRWQLLIRSPDPRAVLEAHPLVSWQPPGLVVEIILDPINLL